MIDGLPDEVLLEIFHFCKLQVVIGIIYPWSLGIGVGWR
jgi:hypothetical protein